MSMVNGSTSFIPELWGGLECSFNRVGDSYMDQLDLCGHYQRSSTDLHRFAELGIKAIRYPVLWEKTFQRNGFDFSWAEKQLNELVRLGITPIVTLLHHGNGPPVTSLMDERFPELFERYAVAVATKFPWLQYFTLINEPLTTSRFSGLYGLWHPHAKDSKVFATIMLRQMKAIIKAAHAIRKINRHAKFIQTEDLAKTYSTPLLKYQADFENERRWLTFDILTGKFDRTHPLWDFCRQVGVSGNLLEFFPGQAAPPDMLGADHYLASERYLDEHLDAYPERFAGGNGRHDYVDVDAVRVRHNFDSGMKVLLRECWNRYKIPVAISEVHIHGSVDDQIRWFHEAWQTAIELKGEGIDIPSVTAWKLLGSIGWNSLLTVNNGHYERGVFDITTGNPEPTEYTAFLKSLAKNPFAAHPSLSVKPWWRTESRFCFEGAVSVPEL